MRGEYKVPGGKLVAVDLEEVDGRLAQVSVSGDFFLEPDEALGDINAALTGMPVEAGVEQLAGAVTDALADDVSLIGFTAESIGIAIRRALGKATGWDDHEFDVIPAKVLAPALHVALDEVIAREVAAGTRPPTLRFWDWDSPLVVIGSFQSVRNEVDPDGARRHGIDVVRRVSGGGAMFMEPGNTITYSLVVPTSLVEGLSFERSYSFLDEWVIGALADVGVDAHFVPLNDIASDKGKIGGAAQKRFVSGAVLHHVTMAYDIDADKMLEVLRIGREKMSDKGTKSANKRVDPMRSQTGMTRDAILESFAASFSRRYRSSESDYTPGELATAQQLVDEKFATPGWTHRVP
ncbi:biotin/lipoate A/B protein ligase family protein [Terrabacter carboxydivorans]|uniref:Lipoate--protein ligase family protein n=1 Tax=Terrabacter carboxydivorans TaxID=619730 RepID=A0ABP5YCY1_9MICO